MKVSFITTVFNEEKTIETFLSSLFSQSKMPDEIIIVDGGSTDKTLSVISNFKFQISNKKFKIIKKLGNRSVGRNEAIKHATGDIIVASDAGCILDKEWVEKIVIPFLDSHSSINSESELAEDLRRNDEKENGRVDVVAGYYYPITKSVFEKCLAAYTCTMPDRVDPETFLPSSRSVAFKKSVWEKVGGYPESLNTCEDLVFARTLKRKGFSFFFAKDAFVTWPQRHNLQEAFLQFYSYAVGDGQARYIRPQTPFLFLRYILGIVLIVLYVITQSYLLLYMLCLILFIYILWAIRKNYRYVQHWQAFYLLPLLQFTADIAVMAGTTVGLLGKK